jgi:hypothetical protein
VKQNKTDTIQSVNLLKPRHIFVLFQGHEPQSTGFVVGDKLRKSAYGSRFSSKKRFRMMLLRCCDDRKEKKLEKRRRFVLKDCVIFFCLKR